VHTTGVKTDLQEHQSPVHNQLAGLLLQKTLRAPISAPDAAVSTPTVVAYADRERSEDSNQAHIDIHCKPSLFVPPDGVDHQGYQRLVWLETRATQAEARLAAQEVLIFKLQHELARMEQVVSASVRTV
jgi:hypothetical protein